MELSLDGVALDLLFKRRLISRGRRQHVFVCRSDDFSTNGACSVSYRAKGERQVHSFQTKLKLADWPSASVIAVVHAVVEGFEALGGGAGSMGLLARFLDLASSWAPPCHSRFHDGELRAALFEIGRGEAEALSVIAATPETLALESVIAVPLGQERTCLLWRGQDFQRAFLEHRGDLLELRTDTARVGESALVGWFAELVPDHQDAVIDGLRMLAEKSGVASDQHLGRHLARSRTFRLGRHDIDVVAAFSLGAKICVALRAPGDIGLSVSVSGLNDGEGSSHALTPAAAFGPGEGQIIFSTTDDAGERPVDGTPLRVTIGTSDFAQAHWLTLQGLESRSARRRIRGLVDWQVADEAMVRDFANAMVSVAREQRGIAPTAISLSSIASQDDAVHLVCRHDGDLAALRSTLIAFSLTIENLELRLVSSRRPSPRELLDLRALCEEFRLPALLVTLEDGMPFSDAVSPPPDNSPRILLLADSGLVPLERDWWQRALALVTQEPTLLYYGLSGTMPNADSSAISFLAGGPPLLIAGHAAARELLPRRLEFQTLEGTAHYALAAAAKARCLERLGWLRLAGSGPSRGGNLGAVRLDGAVVGAAVGNPLQGASGKARNLVRLSIRDGSVDDPESNNPRRTATPATGI